MIEKQEEQDQQNKLKTLEKEKKELSENKDQKYKRQLELQLKLLDLEKQQQQQEEKQQKEEKNQLFLINPIKKLFQCAKRKKNNEEEKKKENQNIKNNINDIQTKISNIETEINKIQTEIEKKNHDIEITKNKIYTTKMNHLKKMCFRGTSDPYRKKAIMNANTLEKLKYAVEAKGSWGGTSRASKILENFLQSNDNNFYQKYIGYDLKKCEDIANIKKHILNMHRCVPGGAKATPNTRPRT